MGVLPPTDESEGWNEWEQDPDTLDTWFGAALWTWSTLIDQSLTNDYELTLQDLLDKSLDFQTYHPTSVMETGWDILFFWVARMILMTTYVTKEIPFKTVYLHGMIRAEDGKKMSKSRPESIIDPLTVIPKYGTDALRMALIMGVSPGNDQNWGWGKIEANRNFCNKLWNVARYIEDKAGDKPARSKDPKPATVADAWVLARLQTCADNVAKDIEKLSFAEAYDRVYHFVWDDFADWYIEASKATPNVEVLTYSLETILKIVHPFAPFVTETIWQTLSWEPDTFLAQAAWPETHSYARGSEAGFEHVQSLVSEIRSIKHSIGLTEKMRLHYKGELSEEQITLLKKLAQLSDVTKAEQGIQLLASNKTTSYWLDIDDATAHKYLTKLDEQQKSEQEAQKKLEGRLSNKSYVANAPEELVNETKQQLADTKTRLDLIKQDKKRFSKG